MPSMSASTRRSRICRSMGTMAEAYEVSSSARSTVGAPTKFLQLTSPEHQSSSFLPCALSSVFAFSTSLRLEISVLRLACWSRTRSILFSTQRPWMIVLSRRKSGLVCVKRPCDHTLDQLQLRRKGGERTMVEAMSTCGSVWFDAALSARKILPRTRSGLTER